MEKAGNLKETEERNVEEKRMGRHGIYKKESCEKGEETKMKRI